MLYKIDLGIDLEAGLERNLQPHDLIKMIKHQFADLLAEKICDKDISLAYGKASAKLHVLSTEEYYELCDSLQKVVPPEYRDRIKGIMLGASKENDLQKTSQE